MENYVILFSVKYPENSRLPFIPGKLILFIMRVQENKSNIKAQGALLNMMH